MSEGLRHHDEPIATVTDLAAVRRQRDNPESLDSTELTDDEATELFITQLTHPAMRQSTRDMAAYIHDMLTDSEEVEVSVEQQAWRQRFRAATVAIDIDDRHDRWVESDEVLGSIYDNLINTKARAKELHDERVALRLLRDLRAGELHRREEAGQTAVSDDDIHTQHWLAVVGQLGRAPIN